MGFNSGFKGLMLALATPSPPVSVFELLTAFPKCTAPVPPYNLYSARPRKGFAGASAGNLQYTLLCLQNLYISSACTSHLTSPYFCTYHSKTL